MDDVPRTMLKDVVELVQRAARSPEIIGERCVHAITERASCQACVHACPRQAWVLDDDSLGLIEDQCDGCGLCVPACPQQAIQHSAIAPTVRHWKNRPAALCACEKTDLEAGEGVIPCVHALGSTQLLKLYRQGCRYVLFSRADCDNCPRGATARLEVRLESINLALTQRALPALEYRELSPEQWLHVRAHPAVHDSGQRMSRRQFFRRSTAQAAAAGLQQLHDTGQPALLPGQLMPGEAEQAIWPHLPVLDETACNGCDACVKLCPHGALQLHDDHYRIDPALCSACGVCADVCDQAAITITVEAWQACAQTSILLRQGSCSACGVPFHYPAAQQASDSLCRICRRTGHYKTLHQVYS